MSISERHHYIPKFFIKGFSGEDGLLAVYNKKTDELEKKRKSPKQIFFEWNRNSFNLNGTNTDFLEKIYQKSESNLSKNLKFIVEQKQIVDLKAYDLLCIIYFIIQTHCRVPKQDFEFLDYAKELNPSKFIFKIKEDNVLKNIPDEIFDKLKKEEAFIDTLKIYKSIENIIEYLKIIPFNNWKLYYIENDKKQRHILSDNPVLLRENKNSNILKSELIFPLSKGKTIFNINGQKLESISAECRIEVDILMFIQAEKMVCGPDSEHLQKIADISKFYNTEEKIYNLKKKVFSIFE